MCMKCRQPTSTFPDGYCCRCLSPPTTDAALLDLAVATFSASVPAPVAGVDFSDAAAAAAEAKKKEGPGQ